ncbi:hypothetical protein JQ604_25975 [Bradyrhizobium jicamae]|nr:hypothetical protein [Bradyrhizobium jicamae]MBR0755641.1 hypothetical protein [Bradyrhizobium jicamae]
MPRYQYLLEQAERAERLAKSALDALTVERLMAFAADCRREITQVSQKEA